MNPQPVSKSRLPGLTQCERRGWSLLRVVGEDSGASSATLERAGSQRALDILDGGNADILLIAKLDRLLRRPPPYERVPRVLQHLTQREPEVFTMISRGLANDQIVKALVVSEATVKTHVNRILAKLNLRSRVRRSCLHPSPA